MKRLDMRAFVLTKTSRNGELYKEYKNNYQYIKKADELFNVLLGEDVSHRASEYLATVMKSQMGKNIREEYRAYGAKLFQEQKEWNKGIEDKIAFRKDYFQSHPDFFKAYIRDELKIDVRFFNPTEENMREVCKRMRDVPKTFQMQSNHINTCTDIIDQACKSDMPVYVTVALLSNEKAYVVRLRTKKPNQRDGHYDHNDTCIIDIYFSDTDKKYDKNMVLQHIIDDVELIENNETTDGKGRSHVKSSILYKYNPPHKTN